MVTSVLPFVLIFGSVTAAAALTVMAWRQRPKPGATAFAVLMAAGTWWVATSAIGLFTLRPGPRLLLHALEWPGVAVFPVAWVVFALEYTSRDEYVTPRTVAALLFIPTVTVLLVATTGVHDLIYLDRTVNVYGNISLVASTYGIWRWVFAAYAYGLLAVGTLLVFQLAVSSRTLYRGQAAALLLTVAAPWAGNVIFVTGLSPVQHFDPTPYMFIISGAMGIAALTQFDLLGSTPVSSRIARDQVVESMDDGVVVVDTDDTIVDINPRAAAIIECDPAAVVEASAVDLVPGYADLRERDDPDATETVALERPGGTRYYEVSATPLQDNHDRQTGCIVGIHDVTERRNRVQQLDVLNRVLRHNLRNEMNVVYGYAGQLNGENEEIADRIQEKVMRMVELGDKAREIDRILTDSDEDRSPIDLVELTEIEVKRARDTYPAVDYDLELPDQSVQVSRTFGPVLRNLLENAAEHNDSEEAVVTVAISVDDAAVTAVVSDNGPGIPEAERSVLRRQEEDPLEHSSGLGLWLVNWGVQRMGGTIAVDCPPAGGTTVTVTLPAVEVPEPTTPEMD
jgi:PAS domain S-box-containing protein